MCTLIIFFNDAVSRHTENQMQSGKIIALEKEIAEIKEELCMTRNINADLKDKIKQQSDLLSIERIEKQSMKDELADKMRTNDNLQAKRNDMKDLMDQLKMELADNENKLMKNMIVKDEALTKLKQELAIKQNSLDDLGITIQRHSSELEYWQKESQENMHKIFTLEQANIEKGAELVTTRSEMSNLHCQLVQQSDHLSGMMTSYADKEQALQNELDDKNTNIDNLHADNALLKGKLDDAKHVIQQLKSQHSVELEQWQKERLELLEKSMHLNKDLVEKEEELVVARQEMSNLNNQLAKQSDHLNGMMTSYADKERALQNELDDKNTNIDHLHDDNVMLKAELDDAKYVIQELKVKHLMELEEWEKQRLELLEKSMHLNKDLVEKEEELVVARQEISDLNNQLAQQLHQLNAEIADKQNLQNTLADRKSINWRIVDKLELDNEMVKAKLHDAEELIEQLKMQHLVVKEQLTKDDEEKVIESKYPIEANNDGASSMENKENQNSLPEHHVETTTLLQDTTNKVESDDNENIVQSKHQTEGRNDEDSTSEKSLPKQPAETTALPQEGVNKVESDADEKIVESKCQIKANNDGTSNVDMESKGNQNSLPKQHAETTALPQEGVNEIECNDDVESKCQIEANDDQAFSVESKKNQNSLPKRNAETAAQSQEAVNKVESDDHHEKIIESKCQIEANNDGASIVHIKSKQNQNSLSKQQAESTTLPQDTINKFESDDDEKIVQSEHQIEARNDKDEASTLKNTFRKNQNSLPKQHADTTALSQVEIHRIDSSDDEESMCQIKANNDGGSSVHLESKENQISLPKQHAETTALSQEGVNKVKSTSDDDEKIVESKCQIEANNDGASALGKIENQNSLHNQHAETTARPQEATNKVERSAAQAIPIISDSCKEVSH